MNNIMKRTLAVLLAVALTLSNFPDAFFSTIMGNFTSAGITVEAETEGDAGSVSASTNDVGETETESETESETEEETSEEAIMLTATAGSTLQAQIDEITTAGTITLDGDYEEDIIIASDTEVTIDLNGYSIIAGGTDKNVITVYGTLILMDGSASGEGTVENNDFTNVRGVDVIQGGSFIMQGGTISGFSISGNGGGVLVEKNATFTMTGGTIDGNTSTGYGGGVYVFDADNIANMTGGTISNNTSKTSGGGLSASTCTSGNLVLPSGLKITDNTASSYGGGVYFNNTLTSLTISSTISDNESGSAGGGVYFGMSISTVNITDATIDGNIAGDAGGGVYFAVKVAAATITDSSISGNTAAGNGGGLWFTSGTSLTLENGSKINSNKITASGALYGGGIYLNSSSSAMSTFTSTGGEISHNIVDSVGSTTSYGGGIYVGTYAKVTMTDTVVSYNSGATYGGGIYVSDYERADVALENLTVSNNYAKASSTASTGSGGGIYINNSNQSTSYTVIISGGTYSENAADYQGGGIYVSMRATLNGAVVVSDNTAYNAGGGILTPTMVLEGGETDAETIKITGNTSQTSYGGGAYATSSIAYALTATGYVEVSGNKSSTSNGGGLAVNRGSMYLDGTNGHISIHDNTATNGGGLYSYYGSGGSIKLEGNVEIYDNTATGTGAGVYSSYYAEIGDGVKIYNNYATSSAGGVYAKGITMTGGEIYGNSGTSAGGIHIVAGLSETDNYSTYTADGASHISGGSIHDNTARTSNGGGINLANSTTGSNILYIEGNVEIYGNTAYTNGGGVWVGDRLYFTGGSIHDNTATTRGGGVFVGSYQGQTATLKIAEGSTGIIYDNTSSTVNGGNDVALCTTQTNAVYSTTNNGNAYATLIMGEASTFKDFEKEITGTAWYYETGAENLTGSISQDSDTSYYTYTFVYEAEAEVAEVWNTTLNDYEIFPTVQAAVDAIASDKENKYGTTIIMIDDSREDVDITANLTVTLDLNGNMLRGMAGSVITVEVGADLTVIDSTADETTNVGAGSITGGSGSADKNNDNYSSGKLSTNVVGGGLLIYGSVTLKSGTITGNVAQFGAGVYVANGGTFTMSGGSITANRSGSGGGGVYARSASYSSSTSFTLISGTISGNTATNGAGVYLYATTCNISGGSITGNTSTSNGGGIYTGNAKTVVNITGGEIIGNKVTGTNYYGGGIYVTQAQSVLDVESSAKIYDNTAASKSANDIYMTITSGSISLPAASSMSDSPYDSWYDTNGSDVDGTSYPYYYYNTIVNFSSISSNPHVFYLTATDYPSGYVAYIPSNTGATIYQYATDDESGNTVYAYATTLPTGTSETAKSIGTAYTTLQAAINASASGDTIYLLCDQTEDVSISAKTLTIDLNGYTLYTEDAYGFSVVSASNTGASADITIKDASKDDTATKDAFHNTVTGAVGTLTPSENNSNEFPRAIYSTANVNWPSTITIDGVKITGYGNEIAEDEAYKSTAYYGGAIYVNGYNTVTIKGYSVLSENAACYGGAVYIGGNNVYLTIEDNVEISENEAYVGGAIYFTTSTNNTASVYYYSSLTIGKATLSDNYAVYQAGAIYVNCPEGQVDGVSYNTNTLNRQVVTFTNTVIKNNYCAGSGGAVYTYATPTVTMTGCTIEENSSGGQYGGVFFNTRANNSIDACFTITDTDFVNNTGGTGYGA